MVQFVHVPMASLEGKEPNIASLTFGPVVVTVKVVFEISRIIERIIAVTAVVHFGG